jgi:hypothetical protein
MAWGSGQFAELRIGSTVVKNGGKPDNAGEPPGCCAISARGAVPDFTTEKKQRDE